MADPSVRSVGTRRTNANVLAPAGVVAGDLILVEVGSALTGTVGITGFNYLPVWTTTRQGAFLWKIADSTDVSLSASAGNYTLTGAGGGPQVAFAIQDADPVTPIRSYTGSYNTTNNTTTDALSLPSLTAGDLLMWFVTEPVGSNITIGTIPTGSTRLLPTSSGPIHATSLSQATTGSSISFVGQTINVNGKYVVGLIAIMPMQADLAQIAVTFPQMTTSMTTVSPTASVAVAFPLMQVTASGVIGQSLLGVTFPVFQSALTAYANSLTQAVTFPKFTTSLTTAQTTATSAVTFPKLTTAMVTAQTTATHAVTFPKMTASITVVSPIQIATVFPKFTAALSGGVQSIVSVAITFPKFKPATSGGVQSIVHHAVTFPKFRVALGITTTTAPTWQEVVRSAEYLAAAAASTRNVSARVEMVDDNELVVAAIPITGGNVSCDSTVDERWAATITLGESDYMPSEVTDLLHPLSGLRARIWWTLELPSGLLAEVPIGTYYSSTPAATNNGTFGLTVKLLDVTSRIRRNKWGTGDVTDLGGMTVSAALRAVFTNRAPRFTAQITDTTETLPAIYEVGQVGRDPLSDILSIADAGAYTVYSDRMGGLVAEPRGNTDNTRTVLDLSVGPDCRMESIQRSLDETQLLNVVTVQSTSSEVDPPVFATVQDNDPASPLWVGNGFIYSDVISSDSVTTEAQCRTLATVTLAERRALIESVDCVHRSRPEIDPLNLLTVNEPKTGASGVYQLASWSIDLEPGSMQRSVLSDRRVAV